MSEKLLLKGFVGIIFVFIVGFVCVCAGDFGKSAYEKLREGDRYKSSDVEKAAGLYFEAASLYEQALKQDPDNGAFKTNYKYCLGSRGFFQIKKAEEFYKKEDFARAHKLFSSAVKSYEYAVKKIPAEKGFETNLQYAKSYTAKAFFEKTLKAKGKAPDFELVSFSGRKLRLSGLRGKVVLLEFWASWCPACGESLAALEDIHKRYSARGLAVVAVSMDKVKKWRRGASSEKNAAGLAKKFSFESYWGTEEIESDYGAFSSVPSIYIIDRKGNLAVNASKSYKDAKGLEDLVRKVMEE